MYGDIVERLKNRLISGIGFSISAYGNKYVSERLARKHLKEHSELVVGLGTALVYDALLKDKVGKLDPYADKIVDGFSDFGFWSETKYKLIKEPIAFFTDANTIKVLNMDIDTIDSTYIKVYVDDTAQTVSAVDGETGNFTISLASPVSEGWHKVVIQAGNAKKDTFRGKLYTPA